MVLKMFSIRDTKGEIYNNPFFQKTAGEAQRSFKSLVNDDKSSIKRYPEDYHLYYLGEYDDQTGKFAPLDAPVHQCSGVDVLDKN